MEAIFYLFGTQLVLLLLVLVTLLLVIIVPSSIFNKKNWGWLLIIVEIIGFIVSTWIHIQPKSYS